MQSFNSITSLELRGMQFLINYLSITAILRLKPIDTIIEVMRWELLSRAFLKFSITKVLLVVAADFLCTLCGIYRSLYDRMAIDLISKFFTGLASIINMAPALRYGCRSSRRTADRHEVRCLKWDFVRGENVKTVVYNLCAGVPYHY